MKASVVTFAQLPDEEPAFLDYLTKTGDVWARPVESSATCEPAPAASFLRAHASALSRNGLVRVYLGLRADILTPTMTEAGDIDIFGSCLVDYSRGGYYPSGELAQSNLFFYRSAFRGEEFVVKPEGFL